jgi:hypothetical protein
MDTPNLPDSWRRPTNSLTRSGLSGDRLEALTVAAKRLFSQFRTDAAVDPKTYLVAVIAVFEHYSDAIVMAVTHPFSGIASRQNWLPTIHEIRKACDDLNAPPKRTLQDAIAETLARRREDEKLLLAKPSEESRAAHVERLRAEGKLAFASHQDKRDIPWFHRLTKAEAQDTLERYARDYAPTRDGHPEMQE